MSGCVEARLPSQCTVLGHGSAGEHIYLPLLCSRGESHWPWDTSCASFPFYGRGSLSQRWLLLVIRRKLKQEDYLKFQSQSGLQIVSKKKKKK